MSKLVIGVTVILFTILIYILARALHKRFPLPITIPILVATIIGVVFLLLFRIPYETYMIGGEWIEWLLGPAIVALAYPLYQQWEMLKKYPLSIFIGVIVGASAGVTVAILLAKLVQLDEEIILSLIPLNSTTAVATEVAKAIGGIPSMTALFVMIAGIGGAVIGPAVLAASHAIGTSKILEEGLQEGAASSVSMTITAVVISIISPIAVFIFF
mgnify:CR=1 FL=1